MSFLGSTKYKFCLLTGWKKQSSLFFFFFWKSCINNLFNFEIHENQQALDTFTTGLNRHAACHISSELCPRILKAENCHFPVYGL